MKELQEKSKELNMKIGYIKVSIKNVKEHIEFLKQHEMDYLGWEEELNNLKHTKMDLEKKVQIINNAEDILLGIEEVA